MLGYLVDVGVPVVVYTLVALIIGVLSGLLFSSGSGGGIAAGVILILVFVVLAVFGLAGFQIWNSAYRRGTKGQTIGQKMVKIKTVSEETGQPIGFGNAFLRDLCHGLDGLACGVGYLAPLWDEKRQTWADKIVRTVVVRVDSQPGSFQSGHPQQPGFPQPPGYGQ